MVAQKCQKKFVSRNFLHFFLIIWKTVRKSRALGNYFCLEMISKVAPHKFFQKNIQILEAWTPIKDMKFRLDFFFTCPSTHELNII